MSETVEYALSYLNPISASVYAMNGKSVEIDNTDAEGRLVLSGWLNKIFSPERLAKLPKMRCIMFPLSINPIH